MAKMLPDINLENIEDLGEREVYKQIKSQLPNDWIVRHHFTFDYKSYYGIKTKEIDFIILAPRLGVLVVEVKQSTGGEMIEGEWWLIKKDGSKEKLRKTPFQQAIDNTHTLIEELSKNVLGLKKNEFPGLYSHLVIFPFGEFIGKLPASIDVNLFVGFSKMNDLLNISKNALLSVGSNERGSKFHGNYFELVKNYIAETSLSKLVIGSTIFQDTQEIDAITEKQYSFIKYLHAVNRLHITGPAGSGKTMIGFWRAKMEARLGKKVLYVCYNRTLAEWLKLEVDNITNFHVESFFSLAKRIIKQAGFNFISSTETDKDSFFNEEAPQLLCDSIDILNIQGFERYDSIIVDEAQDFHENWALPIQLLLKDPDKGSLCILSDPKQRGIYNREGFISANFTPFDLFENCRNTIRISDYSASIIKTKIEHLHNSPLGKRPIILDTIKNIQERAEAIRKHISNLLNEEKILASQIAVLSPYRSENERCSTRNIATICGKRLTDDINWIKNWKNGSCIWSSTIKSFKGLEAACVVLTDIPKINTDSFTSSDLYVAITRAKSIIYIFPDSPESESDLKEYLTRVR